MDIQAFVDSTEKIETTIKAGAAVGPLLVAIWVWLQVRVRYQRRYMRAVRQLAQLPRYLEKRREAFGLLDAASQITIEELEVRIAREVKLDLSPAAIGSAGYLAPADQGFFKQAIRQLDSVVFRDLANDLVERLNLLLDALADIENHRKLSRWASDHLRIAEERKLLRQQVQEDRKRIEVHLRMMQQFLAGEVAVDLYPASTAANLRLMLNGKYAAYRELTNEDSS